MSEIRIHTTTAIALLALGAGILFFAAYSYSRLEAAEPAVTHRTSVADDVFVGRIIGFEPPSVLMRSIWDPEESVQTIIVDPHTRILKLVPWEPGERDETIRAFKERVAGLGLKRGDRVPAPPGEMKPVPMPASELTAGLEVAVALDPSSNDGSPLSAALIRPLTEKEIAERGLSATFPY